MKENEYHEGELLISNTGVECIYFNKSRNYENLHCLYIPMGDGCKVAWCVTSETIKKNTTRKTTNAAHNATVSGHLGFYNIGFIKGRVPTTMRVKDKKGVWHDV